MQESSLHRALAKKDFTQSSSEPLTVIKITQKLLYMTPPEPSPIYRLSGYAIAVTSPGCWWFTRTHFPPSTIQHSHAEILSPLTKCVQIEENHFPTNKQERIMGYILSFSCDDQQ